MPILTQLLFALMSGNFMSLTFSSAGHVTPLLSKVPFLIMTIEAKIVKGSPHFSQGTFSFQGTFSCFCIHTFHPSPIAAAFVGPSFPCASTCRCRMIKRMEKQQGEFRFLWSAPEIREIIQGNNKKTADFTLHYNQNEEFFIKLDKAFLTPHFPIHHNVDRTIPSDAYRSGLKRLMEEISSSCSGIFEGLTYLFDPSEIFRPLFYQLYKVKEEHYLFLLHLDLSFRPNSAEMQEPGNNDISHAFLSDQLYLDAEILPIDSFIEEHGRIVGCNIAQDISKTWIGESGRGYVIQGIWIDRDLTKFFSKLLLPPKIRYYPYYPFSCKYRAICHSVLRLLPEGRIKHLKILHQALPFLRRNIDTIQECLKHQDFSVELDPFIRLKQGVPDKWYAVWETLSVIPYLNDHDMKEFRVEFS